MFSRRKSHRATTVDAPPPPPTLKAAYVSTLRGLTLNVPALNPAGRRTRRTASDSSSASSPLPSPSPAQGAFALFARSPPSSSASSVSTGASSLDGAPRRSTDVRTADLAAFAATYPALAAALSAPPAPGVAVDSRSSALALVHARAARTTGFGVAAPAPVRGRERERASRRLAVVVDADAPTDACAAVLPHSAECRTFDVPDIVEALMSAELELEQDVDEYEHEHEHEHHLTHELLLPSAFMNAHETPPPSPTPSWRGGFAH